MKITDTETYLSLALAAMEDTIIPALTSNEAIATAEITRSVLAELIKREDYTLRLLAEQIAEGRRIANRMTSLLVELGGSEIGRETEAVSGGGFQTLAESHGLLTAQLFRLAGALSAQRGTATNAAQEQQLSDLLRKAADWEYGYYIAQRDAVAPLRKQPQSVKQGGPLTRELLEVFLRSRHPDGDQCVVTSFEPIPGGFSKQTFRVTLRDHVGNLQALIVRKSIPTPPMALGLYIIDQEFYLLRDVFSAGLPVAEPLYLGTDVPGIDGDFYVMTALPGKLPGTFLGGASKTLSESVFLQLAELLARLHSMSPDVFSDYLSRYGRTDAHSDTVESCYRRCIAEWKACYAQGGHLPSPAIAYMFDWLEQNVPRKNDRPVLVHGDFNIHNVLTEGDRITGILDWESGNFGMPEQDLSWIKPHIAAHINWERFINHYQACGGAEIDEGAMNFCLAFSCMRVAVGLARGLSNLQSGNDQAIRYTAAEQPGLAIIMGLGLASCTRAGSDL